jgi:CubicO group peptidase (beta-lactamase class C family)
VFSEARGPAHIELGVPATPSTIFQLSSTAKLFTGITAMRLVERGHFSLDDPITDYLDAAPAGWHRVTVRHLLSMTSGIPDPANLNSSATAVDILRQLYGQYPTPEPGKNWVYGASDFLLAQLVLEKVANLPFERLVRREIFEPAGMTSAQYWRSHRDVIFGAATDYYPDSTVVPRRYVQREFDFPEYLFAAGGVAASLEDLLRLSTVLNTGRLLPAALRDTMWTDTRLETGRTVSYGIGWDTKTHAPGRRSAGHSGGYLTTFRMYPDARLAVIVLTNGFLVPVNTDDLATAFAAVWDPGIAGLPQPPCTVSALADAKF